MTKSGKRRIYRNRAQNKRQNQSRERHQIVTNPTPEQKAKNTEQQAKKNEMFGAKRHGSLTWDEPYYFGASRIAPSSRITSPFSISLSMI